MAENEEEMARKGDHLVQALRAQLSPLFYKHLEEEKWVSRDVPFMEYLMIELNQDK